MGFWSKLVILMLAALAFFYVKVNFFDTPHAKVEKKLVSEEQVVEPVKEPEQVTQNDLKKEEQQKKKYIRTDQGRRTCLKESLKHLITRYGWQVRPCTVRN